MCPCRVFHPLLFNSVLSHQVNELMLDHLQNNCFISERAKAFHDQFLTTVKLFIQSELKLSPCQIYKVSKSWSASIELKVFYILA